MINISWTSSSVLNGKTFGLSTAIRSKAIILVSEGSPTSGPIKSLDVRENPHLMNLALPVAKAFWTSLMSLSICSLKEYNAYTIELFLKVKSI